MSTAIKIITFKFYIYYICLKHLSTSSDSPFGEFSNCLFFTSASPTPQPPTWWTRVSFLVWHLNFGLSDKEGPTSSYATVSIAFRLKCEASSFWHENNTDSPILHSFHSHPSIRRWWRRQGHDEWRILKSLSICHVGINYYRKDYRKCKFMSL